MSAPQGGTRNWVIGSEEKKKVSYYGPKKFQQRII